MKKVEKADNFEENGQWIVTTKTIDGGKERKEKYDFVLVCNGHLTEPNKPRIPGLEKFKGRVLHTHDYKDFRGFEDKRVLVIGIGNSAADVACELSRHASHVSKRLMYRNCHSNMQDFANSRSNINVAVFHLANILCK